MPNRLRELDRAPLEDDLAERHPGDVEKVVDQMGELSVLSRDDLAGARGGLRRRILGVEHAHRVRDGGERVAQLVAQHGEEMVLAAARRFGFGAGRLLAGEQARLLDGRGGVVGQRHERRLVRHRERTARAVVRIDHAHDGARRPDRGRHARHDAVRGGDGPIAVVTKPRVGLEVLGADRAAGGPRQTPDPLAALDHEARPHHGRVGRRVAQDEAPGLVDERDARAVGAHQAAHGLERRPENRIEVRRGVQRVGDLRHRAGLALAQRSVLLAGVGEIGGGDELLGDGVHLGQPGVRRLRTIAALDGMGDTDEGPDRSRDPPTEQEGQRGGDRRGQRGGGDHLPQTAAQRALDGGHGRGEHDAPARQRGGGKRHVDVGAFLQPAAEPALAAWRRVGHAAADHLLPAVRASDDDVLAVLQHGDRVAAELLRDEELGEIGGRQRRRQHEPHGAGANDGHVDRHEVPVASPVEEVGHDGPPSVPNERDDLGPAGRRQERAQRRARVHERAAVGVERHGGDRRSIQPRRVEAAAPAQGPPWS